MMVTLAKLVIVIITTLSTSSTIGYEPIKGKDELTAVHVYNYTTKDSKTKAFQILENKCNVCHKKRNKRRVFTIENMNTWANDINKQVFIKKRMPKGKKIKLTSQEYQDLLTWISYTKTSNNGI
ncbi:hypothetical protein [uncultured Psychroserpens sp.]|uniref:hypothetical protein n=1 Tax=uncultured Psychroserpens sp. TaxID=255436 RepID=UPI002625E226|nr:hypothetical protein [uncultured Psychroserpens sp.]